MFTYLILEHSKRMALFIYVGQNMQNTPRFFPLQKLSISRFPQSGTAELWEV